MILENIRIIDVTQFFMGPVAAAHLADMGAEVIHIESLRGDGGRGVETMRTVSLVDWNCYFDANNRNKKSMAVDLTTQSGREILYKLVEKSDVFITNMTRRALKKLSIDYATLSGINPRLVYVIGSAYGRYGPDSDKAGYDVQGQARAGIMPTLGEPGQPPVYTGTATGDATGALLMALGTMLALYKRDINGEMRSKGQEVEVALLGSQIAFAGLKLQTYLATKNDYYLRRRSRKKAPNPLFNIYRAKDNWIFLAMRDSQKHWHDFCHGMGIEEIEDDPKYNTAQKRCENSPQLISLLDVVFSSKTVAEWLEHLKGLNILASPINTLAEAAVESACLENHYLEDVEHPVYGKVRVMGSPVQLSKTPASIRSIGLELGQHTEEILTDLLGYNWNDITRLKEQGAII